MTDQIEKPEVEQFDNRRFDTGVSFYGSRINGSDMGQMRFDNVELNRSVFEGSDFRRTTFSNSKMQEAMFHNVDFGGARMADVKYFDKKLLMIFHRGDYTLYLTEEGKVAGGCMYCTIAEYRAHIACHGYGVEKRKVMGAFLDAAEAIYNLHQSSAQFRAHDWVSEYSEEE